MEVYKTLNSVTHSAPIGHFCHKISYNDVFLDNKHHHFTIPIGPDEVTPRWGIFVSPLNIVGQLRHPDEVAPPYPIYTITLGGDFFENFLLHFSSFLRV